MHWYSGGKIKEKPDLEFWFRDGLFHRADGPAVISHYCETTGFGAKTQNRWYWYGKEMTPMELFERLSEEEKEKAVWNLDQWMQ